MKYVIDSNILIEAYHRYYAFDLAPKFWNELQSFALSEEVVSIDKVQEEIIAGNDNLADWVRTEYSCAFKPTTSYDVIKEFGQMQQWAAEQVIGAERRFIPQALADFASVADGWIVAYARVNDLVVVTHERSNSMQRNRVVIPEVCNAFGVRFVQTFDMLRDLNVKFQ